MKLILVNRYFHPDISATSRLASDLALDQAARGREVHVVTGSQLYEDPRAALPALETHGGVRIHRVRTTRFGRGNLAGRALDYLTFFAAATRRLARIAGAGDVIVAKTDPPMLSVAAGWVARRRGAVLVNWLQDVFPEIAERLGVRGMRGPLGALARSLRNRSLRFAAANVAVGERMAATIAAAAPGASVEVIGNWVDGALVRPVEPADNALRAAWGLEGRFVAGYSGNLGRAHESETLLRAAEALRDDAGIAFLFVGGGSARAALEVEAARRSLVNVLFRPYQPRELLAASLSVADVHLVTLRPELEGLVVPSKVHAAAAAGRPTIFVGDVDGEVARMLARERCGRAVAAGDVTGLVAALRELRADPALARAMGEHARAAFERRFDRPVALEHWNRVIARLV